MLRSLPYRRAIPLAPSEAGGATHDAASHPLLTQDRKLLALEAVTVLLVAGLALWSVRPLVEEWGTLANFRDAGPLYPWGGMLPQMALRPLHMAGYLLQWVAGGGAPIGVAIAAAMIMVARYFVVRWAFSPFVGREARWVLATLGAVMFMWPAAWLGRFVAAQIAVLLFFAALGLSLRFMQRGPSGYLLLGTLIGFVSLLFYQGLALLMPYASLVCLILSRHAGRSWSESVARSATMSLPLLAYIAYYVYITNVIGLDVYEDHGVQSNLNTSNLLTIVLSCYKSVNTDSVWIIAVLVLLLVAIFVNSKNGVPLKYVVYAVATVFVLPMTGIVYGDSVRLFDSDRILFGISAGYIVLLFSVIVLSEDRFNLIMATSLVVGSIALSLIFIRDVVVIWRVQNELISYLVDDQMIGDDDTLLIQDDTGLYANLYTFPTEFRSETYVNQYLGSALALVGKTRSVFICTEGKPRRLVVERYRAFAIPSCDDDALPVPDIRLIVTSRRNGIAVSHSPGLELQLGKRISFGASGSGSRYLGDGWSGQEADYRWSEGPTASLTVELPEGGAAELVLRLDPFLGGGLDAQHVAVAIDGIEAGTWAVDRRDDYAVAIPPEAIGDGRLEIVLSISNPTPPCTVSESTDCRPLGVAIRKLVVN